MSELVTTELRHPEGFVDALRLKLERKLNAYVVTYKSTTFDLSIPLQSRLCANFAGAKLTSEQLRVLRRYEEMVAAEKVSLVAYARPLQLIVPAASLLSEFYNY